MTLEQLRIKMQAVQAAMELNDLQSAILLIKGICHSEESTQGLPITQSSDEKEVVYGKGGYTDKGDPRQPNASTHTLEGGRVKAVWLTVHVKPSSRFKCVNAFLIDEDQAQGQTTIFIDVKDKSGRTVNSQVIMATGYKGQDSDFDDYLVPGNAYRPVQHILADTHSGGGGVTFTPPDLGPIAIFVAKGNDIRTSDSDVVGNIGLPYAHHVSYMIEFVER